MVWPPVEPPASPWTFGLSGARPGTDLVALGADLDPGTLLTAYRSGLFPMGVGRGGVGPIGWWSPDPRGVLPPAEMRVTRSLRASVRRYDVTVDTAFPDVVAGCADPDREGRWITDEVTDAYTELHRLGWAHSVEVWRDGQLVGGLYGVAVAGLFAGESMFHRQRDASKVALAALCDHVLDGDPRRIIDVQWRTDHLASLGVVAWPRERYLTALHDALESPDLRFVPGPWRAGRDTSS